MTTMFEGAAGIHASESVSDTERAADAWFKKLDAINPGRFDIFRFTDDEGLAGDLFFDGCTPAEAYEEMIAIEKNANS